MIGQEKVYETLKALGIEFDYLEHPEAPTIEILFSREEDGMT